MKGVPATASGRYRRIKTGLACLLLGWFFLVPFLRWDRGPDLPGQAILFDLPGRRLFLFGWEFWPQDLPIAVGLLVGAASLLFYATALAGRVWCGFACPQTVWTDLFFAVDRFCEHRRIPPVLVKIAIALLTGFGFACWFTDAPTLAGRLLGGSAAPGSYGAVLIIGGLTWLLGVYAKQRVCLHMCPWPRFQAALLDRDSQVVTYQSWRGESRGRKRIPLREDLGGEPGGTRGDCIDCTRCVAVCPTLIDIRDGLQMGCIGCGLCVDACDTVMEKIGRPAGLIRFDSETNADAKSWTKTLPRPFAAKPMLFLSVAVLALGAALFAMLTLSPLRADLDPQRNPLFVRLSDGGIRNDFLLHIQARQPGLSTLRLRLAEGEAGLLRLASSGDHIGAETVDVTLDQRELRERLLITRPAGADAKGRSPLHLLVLDARDGRLLGTVETQFWGPES